MVRRCSFLVVLALSCSKSDPPQEARPTAAPTPVPADTTSLGAATFAVSEGTPEARGHFARGLLALHSFWYDEATRAFQQAVAADPTMKMAYWGAAMSSIKLLWGDDDLGAARAVLARMPEPAKLTAREQAWVHAATELVADGNVRSSRARFLAAMETVHAKFPDDESATFLAIALVAATHPEDPDSVTVRKRAAGLAATVFEHNPDHPGAAHYAIHAYDTPELASLGLPYAKKYAQIAPAAFHARHMPAHIFSRLGMWKEAIASCRSAWDASIGAATASKLSADHHDFHSLNWVIEMSFELGLRKDADAAMKQFGEAVRAGLGRKTRTLYAVQVTSFMARAGAWARLDELLAPLESPAIGDPPGGAARDEPSHCAPTREASPLELQEQMAVLNARARVAAAKRDVTGATKFLDQMEAVSAKIRPMLQATQPPPMVAKFDESNARRRASLLARATGNDQALLKILRESTADADRETGGEANPSSFEVHEEIAETLMRLGQPKEAAAEYALALAKHPRRARSTLGAARAATKLGDKPAALARYTELAELWSGADDGIDGLAEARAAIKR
ncbi:MAG: hypothetical protein ABI867_42200 [Kofleriaceae bacterium]